MARSLDDFRIAQTFARMNEAMRGASEAAQRMGDATWDATAQWNTSSDPRADIERALNLMRAGGGLTPTLCDCVERTPYEVLRESGPCDNLRVHPTAVWCNNCGHSASCHWDIRRSVVITAEHSAAPPTEYPPAQRAEPKPAAEPHEPGARKFRKAR